MSEKELRIKGRVQNKHGTEAYWTEQGTSVNPFTPLDGELIIYDIDASHAYKRYKIGDGVTPVHNLPFIGLYAEHVYVSENERSATVKAALQDLQNMILHINYKEALEFDTSEIVIRGELINDDGSSAILGCGVLGRMILR